MRAAVTSLLRDKPPPFQQACFRCILQFQLISLLNKKTSVIVSLLFCVKHLLIICIHFVLLIKFGSWEVVDLKACPQWLQVQNTMSCPYFHAIRPCKPKGRIEEEGLWWKSEKRRVASRVYYENHTHKYYTNLPHALIFLSVMASGRKPGEEGRK